jgi:transcriptional antiterminator RfaH
MQSLQQVGQSTRTTPAMEWYAAYVKHHHEQKIADVLGRKGVEVFLPQQKVIRKWKDRKKTLSVPLFPSYLFLQFNLADKFRILNTPGVFFMVENAGRLCQISMDEIDSIRRIVKGGIPAQSHPYVTVGDQVRIQSGPLTGLVGILTHFKQRYRVVLTVQTLQKALSIEVELGNVERLGDSRTNLALKSEKSA